MEAFLVISPPELDNYFYEISQMLAKDSVPLDVEFAIAKKSMAKFS